MTASGILRAARTGRGFTQRALAASARVRQPGLAEIESGSQDATVSRLERLLAPLGSQLTILPTRRRPVWAAGDHVRNALDAGDIRSAWREIIQLNDDLRQVDHATCIALAIAPPGPTGDARFDALIAAVTDNVLADAKLPRPEWLDDKRWTLDFFWDVEEIDSLQATARKRTPHAISRHGIYLDRSVLQSV